MKKKKCMLVCVIIVGIVFLIVNFFVISGRVREADFLIETMKGEIVSIPMEKMRADVEAGDMVFGVCDGQILETYPGKLRKIVYVFRG